MQTDLGSIYHCGKWTGGVYIPIYRGDLYSMVVNGPGGSIFNGGKWTGGLYSMVVNGPGGYIQWW